MVSTATICAIAVSAVVSLGLPVLLLLYWRKRTGAKVVSALVGAVIFFVFVYGLENALHQVCIFQANPVSAFIMGNNWAYVLYAGLAAGVFEETGRLVAFKWLLRKRDKKRAGVMYGIGHGGIEAILVAGTAMVSNLVLAFQLNAQGAEAMLVQYAGQDTAVSALLQSLMNTPSALYLVSGLERAIAICLHISLSVLVFMAAKRTGKGWLYPAAILIHAAVDCVAGLYHIGVIPSILWIEVIVLVMTALTALWAWRLYRADEDPAEPVPAAEAPELEQA